MLRKIGIVSVGVTAGLLAVAPLASASEGHHHDKGHHTGDDRVSCEAEGGEFDSSADGDLAGIAAPINSGNNGQYLSCNYIDVL